MRLAEILKDVNVINITGQNNPDISGIVINSKKAYSGCIFAAIPGFKDDGYLYIGEAVKKGAAAVISEKTAGPGCDATQVQVKDCRKELALLCRNFYGSPSTKLKLCGVTGTNGKTTTVFLLDYIFKAAGLKTSFITTVKAAIAGNERSFDRTTPESNDLNDFFSISLKEGVGAACMEVSSHSIDLHRVDWLDFDIFIFTNLTQDHLDYHGDMDNYFNVKKRLFIARNRQLYGGKTAVINIDDPYGKIIAYQTDLKLITFSLNDGSADLKAKNIVNTINGIEMDIAFNAAAKTGSSVKYFSVKSPLCGYFNVYNILAAVSSGIAAGIDIESIKYAVGAMQGVTGRFEKINIDKKINVIVDYAHTPDGLQSVLNTAKSLLMPGARLISVFGCGGDRDTKKRSIMGSISASIADYSIITSDNPRTEEPLSIIKMIEEGFTFTSNNKYAVEEDRKKAIHMALEMADENDIVLIAGKGHENYQEFGWGRSHFSDQEVVKEWRSS
ncbi:MAG: UDP-N-acetylmuramoyl-L-alanyl-D-glutamate--2,6-diaminopimelate ligase [Actinobacteria bacterium]|nr:UDP-N-acetylmuramoyl-L-alanyl-D-glutamate--2,6-diaminopimelate ligase [Actinomycetota bacterium]